jgi:hypothetical protein
MAVLPARLNIVEFAAAISLNPSGVHCGGLYEDGIYKSINGMNSEKHICVPVSVYHSSQRKGWLLALREFPLSLPQFTAG